MNVGFGDNIILNQDKEIVFCSDFLEFTSNRMDITKIILDNATNTFAKNNGITSEGYVVQDHYITYFTIKFSKLPKPSELQKINNLFKSSISMLRCFLADKGYIHEIK